MMRPNLIIFRGRKKISQLFWLRPFLIKLCISAKFRGIFLFKLFVELVLLFNLKRLLFRKLLLRLGYLSDTCIKRCKLWEMVIAERRKVQKANLIFIVINRLFKRYLFEVSKILNPTYQEIVHNIWFYSFVCKKQKK